MKVGSWGLLVMGVDHSYLSANLDYLISIPILFLIFLYYESISHILHI